MKTNKFFNLFFSLVMIAALIVAAVPAVSAHALTPSQTQISSTSAAPDAVVCVRKTVWHNGHRVVIRVCHKVHKSDAE